MKHGFFTPIELSSPRSRLNYSAHCGACGLAQHCRSPKMCYKGSGGKEILVIGEAPGKQEDRENEQFVGKAGRRLKDELKRCKTNLNQDCWKTNARRCYVEGNPTPTSEEINYCRPALFAEIKKLKPHSILLFGAVAAESVLGHLWNDSGKFVMGKWLDWIIPHQELNCWISVHYHPSYLERQRDDLLDLLFRKHLKHVLKKKGRPWKQLPNYQNEVEIIYKPQQVVKALQGFHGTVAFDYEANCLKPEYAGAEIISCSVSDGKRTYAYPWVDDAILATSKLLKSQLPKIASNLKFEERWTRHFLGHRVRNWDWDTMLAAHVLNHTQGITGLKFQSFVQLGQAPYDKHIEPYIKTSKGQCINRIEEIPLKDLLVYNGMDSLLAYEVAVIQKREVQKC